MRGPQGGKTFGAEGRIPAQMGFSPESGFEPYMPMKIKTGLMLFGLVSLLGTGAAHASKRVVVDKSTQTLRAYENGALVFRSRVSTGRPGHETPSGSFSAQSKKRMHYSTLYDNAPMPYSVQIAGNYFIHGFSSVPPFPASHGCIRMPVGSAAAFFNWVEPGTPISVTGKWTPPARKYQPSKRSRTASFPRFGRSVASY